MTIKLSMSLPLCRFNCQEITFWLKSQLSAVPPGAWCQRKMAAVGIWSIMRKWKQWTESKIICLKQLTEKTKIRKQSPWMHLSRSHWIYYISMQHGHLGSPINSGTENMFIWLMFTYNVFHKNSPAPQAECSSIYNMCKWHFVLHVQYLTFM